MPRTLGIDRSAVVAPDPARAPTGTTSKYWGVHWDKQVRRWKAQYTDANGKRRGVGYFDDQEQAAHAVNAAIRRAGLAGKRRTNPVVDGQLVPKSGPRRRRAPAARAARSTTTTPSRTRTRWTSSWARPTPTTAGTIAKKLRMNTTTEA